MTRSEKLTIAQGICAPLLRKIRADLQRNVDPDSGYDENGEANEVGDDENATDQESTVNRLDPRYSSGVSSPGRKIIRYEIAKPFFLAFEISISH